MKKKQKHIILWSESSISKSTLVIPGAQIKEQTTFNNTDYIYSELYLNQEKILVCSYKKQTKLQKYINKVLAYKEKAFHISDFEKSLVFFYFENEGSHHHRSSEYDDVSVLEKTQPGFPFIVRSEAAYLQKTEDGVYFESGDQLCPNSSQIDNIGFSQALFYTNPTSSPYGNLILGRATS